MTDVNLPTGSTTNSSSPAPTPTTSQSQSTSTGLELPVEFINELSSGPIHQFLSKNTSQSDLTPRQVRDSLASLDSVKQLQEKHKLTIDFNDKLQKKQISTAIKTVWESLGELETDDDDIKESKVDLKKDAQLAWKLQKEMMEKYSTTRSGSSSSKKDKDKKNKDKESKTKAKAKAKPSTSKKRARSDEIETDEDPDPDTESTSSKAKKKKTKEEEKKAAKKSKKNADGSEKEKKPPNPNNPFNRPVILDFKMAEICGGDEMPRHGVTKQLWIYIKERKLQDPNNGRKILCDEKLESLFGKKVVDSFEMSKLISSHLSKKDDLI